MFVHYKLENFRNPTTREPKGIRRGFLQWNPSRCTIFSESANMISKSFKGHFSDVSLPDVLEFLRSSRKTGVISFKQDRVRKSLYIKDGNVVFATSNVKEERLGELLLSWSVITREQYEQSVAMLGPKRRQGKILVEMGAISPKLLWQSVQDQIRHIVYSLFNWDRGMFYFSQGDLPSKENITADVGITELIVEGIRRIDNTNAILKKFPSRDIVVAGTDTIQKNPVRLEPFEKHILELVDGTRTVQEVCSDSEIGETETFRVLYMLLSIGALKVKGKRMETQGDPPKEFSQEEAKVILGNYNRMFSYLYRYMMREVGPITEHVLSKYLNDVRESNATVLKNVTLARDGTLDEATIEGNLDWIKLENKKDALVTSLNEYLYSGILAVKRTLGPEHESRVIETLRDIRPEL